MALLPFSTQKERVARKTATLAASAAASAQLFSNVFLALPPVAVLIDSVPS
jgi:hypothetical protein